MVPLLHGREHDDGDSNTVLKGVATYQELSCYAWRRFLIWTGVWWGGVALLLVLFFFGAVNFATSAKASLYLVSIWLNGWMLGLLPSSNQGEERSAMQKYHDCLVIWMVSYAITNLVWEIPWVICSRWAFKDITTIEDVLAQEGYMRKSIFHMWWWLLGSFGTIDLRTVNHNETFFCLELYAFVNVFEVVLFYHWNKARNPMRYMIPVIGAGAPVAFTFMFSFSEVVNGYENMPGGSADTLLALVWTQYQYILFPIIFCYWGLPMVIQDWETSRATRNSDLNNAHSLTNFS